MGPLDIGQKIKRGVVWVGPTVGVTHRTRLFLIWSACPIEHRPPILPSFFPGDPPSGTLPGQVNMHVKKGFPSLKGLGYGSPR